MRIILTILFLLISTTSFSAIDVNECDNIIESKKKFKCLTLLRAKAVKDSALSPVKAIDKKLKGTIDSVSGGIANTTKKMEKKAIGALKKPGQMIGGSSTWQKLKIYNKAANKRVKQNGLK